MLPIEELDLIAEQLYLAALGSYAHRASKGKTSDPSTVSHTLFENLFDEAKDHYRAMAKWHLTKTT